MNRKHSLPLCLVALASGVLLAVSLLSCRGKSAASSAAASADDISEYCQMAYSDIISEVVVGYQTHWAEFQPEDAGVSDVFRHESPYGAFARMDIDGDGVDELVFGDSFVGEAGGGVAAGFAGGAGYRLYDLYAFDTERLCPVHLFSGGERDAFVISGGGIIVETGSNSASESFCRYHQLRGAVLEDFDGLITEVLRMPEFEPVLRYVAPTAFVALKDGQLQGKLVKTLGDFCVLEVQDTVRVPAKGLDIELWSAFDGRGVVFPKNPGQYAVMSAPSADSPVVGTITYESGNVPDAFRCLGYLPGWFKIEFDGTLSGSVPAVGAASASGSAFATEGDSPACYVSEDAFDWDFTNRF